MMVVEKGVYSLERIYTNIGKDDSRRSVEENVPTCRLLAQRSTQMLSVAAAIC